MGVGGCIYMYVCANVYKYTREFNNNKVLGSDSSQRY